LFVFFTLRHGPRRPFSRTAGTFVLCLFGVRTAHAAATSPDCRHICFVPFWGEDSARGGHFPELQAHFFCAVLGCPKKLLIAFPHLKTRFKAFFLGVPKNRAPSGSQVFWGQAFVKRGEKGVYLLRELYDVLRGTRGGSRDTWGGRCPGGAPCPRRGPGGAYPRETKSFRLYRLFSQKPTG
jgi:hypothetical protein